MHRILLALGLLLSLASPSFAWGTKEHVQITRIAVERLIDDPSTPPAMQQWLRDITPERLDMEAERQWFMTQRQGMFPRGVQGITFWAVYPDMVRNSEQRGRGKKIEPFGVSEWDMHQIDVEIFLSGSQKREYRHDLSGKPKLSDFPRDMKDPRYVQSGMLPFRVEETYKKLVEQLKAGRMNDKPGQYPKDEHAARYAGYLAHYIGDNTQPQHATADYKSTSYFANKGKAANVHAQVEYIMNDDELNDYTELRKEFWTAFAKALDEVKDPTTTNDLWQGALEMSLQSYDALPMIGVAAMAAAEQGGTPEKPVGAASDSFDTEVFFRSKGTYMGKEMTLLEMKAYQQAWSVKRIEKLLRRAWDEAHSTAAPATTVP